MNLTTAASVNASLWQSTNTNNATDSSIRMSPANATENLADSIAPLIEPIFVPLNDCVFRPTMENYVMIVTFSVIFCLSVVGNSIVVVVILQQRSMRSVTNLYLLNLALSDLLLSVVCMPPTLVSSLVYCWVFGDLLCKLLAYLQPVVVTASAYTLAAIALERYYAICRPLHSRIWHTRTHAMFVISLVWLVSVIANVFMLFMYEERTYNRNGLNCAPKFEPIIHFGYQIYMTAVLLLIPLVAMTVLYGNVIRTLRSGIRMDIAAIGVLEKNAMLSGLPSGEQLREMPSICGSQLLDNANANGTLGERKKSKSRLPSWTFHRSEPSTASNSTAIAAVVEQSIRSTHSGRTALAKQRLIRMLIVIVVIFFCCWTPSYIWWLLLNAQDAFGTFNIWNSELNTLITVLTYLSSCTNPITYCFLNNKFRNALFLTFGCRSGTGSDRNRQQRGMLNTQLSQGGICRDEPCSMTTSDPNNNNNVQQLDKLLKNTKKTDSNCCLHMLLSTKRAILSSSNSSKRSRISSQCQQSKAMTDGRVKRQQRAMDANDEELKVLNKDNRKL